MRNSSPEDQKLELFNHFAEVWQPGDVVCACVFPYGLAVGAVVQNTPPSAAAEVIYEFFQSNLSQNGLRGYMLAIHTGVNSPKEKVIV